MSKILLALPILLLSLSLVSAYGDQYGGSGQYGRKRREIPAASAQPGQQQQFQPVRGPKKFSVNVADGIRGANQLRKEKWDNGTVTGMYANPLGNNKYQIINYIADDKGYRILSTKVVDDIELAALGGQGKFSPQSGKSAQIDITNDGESTSWTVTPDQIAQDKKTQPEGRSTKDSSDEHADSTKDDEHDHDSGKMEGRSLYNDGYSSGSGYSSGYGKRSIKDKEADSTKDSKDEKDKDDNVKAQGKRSVYGGPSGYMGSGDGYGGGGYSSGGYGKRSVQDSAQQSDKSDSKMDSQADSQKVQGKRSAYNYMGSNDGYSGYGKRFVSMNGNGMGMGMGHNMMG